VTSQQAIEEALRGAEDSGGKGYAVKMVLTIDELGLTHEVTGTIAKEES